MPRRLFIASSLVVAASVLALAQTGDREQTERLAQRATERLQALHDEADRLAAEERSLLGELRKLEVERDIRATELARARVDARTAAAELAALDAQVASLSADATAALPDLQSRLVTLYKLGRGQYARLLLSASDLRQLGQAVRLVSALAEQDRQRVVRYQQRLTELSTTRDAARSRQATVAQLQAAAERAQVASEQALAARTALVHDIDTRRDLNAQFSSELMSAQQRLQASLAGLSSTDAASTLPITPFRGDLAWPTEGAIRQRFGASAPGRPPLRGIELDSAPSTPVHAVHDGTVAFADTFTGYGRLVIVDHGNQTFTLYGNLGELQVEKGAHVSKGVVVGSVGLSDGKGGVLYFELRVDGRPVDPLQWLAKR